MKRRLLFKLLAGLALITGGCGSDVTFKVLDAHSGRAIAGATVGQYRWHWTLGQLMLGFLTTDQFMASSTTNTEGEVTFHGIESGDEFRFSTTDLSFRADGTLRCECVYNNQGNVTVTWNEAMPQYGFRSVDLRVRTSGSAYIIPLLPQTEFKSVTNPIAGTTVPSTRPSISEELRPYEDRR